MSTEAVYAELLEFLTTDSASRKENQIAELLTKKLEALGFAVTMDDAGSSFGGECGNLLAVREGELDGALMFSSHMDRMPNGLGIKPVERDGVLYSDGTTILAADDISGVCAILDGVRRALAGEKPLPRLELVFSVGEEAGLLGAKAFDVSKLQAKMGYIFDSPGRTGRFINAAPGRYMLKAEVTGRSAHAGNEPEKGIDAAKCVCTMLATLKSGRLDPVTTSNFPRVSGTTALNAVCDHAALEGEARSRDAKTLLDYVDYFEEHCRKVAEEFGASVKVTKTESFSPFLIPEEAPVCRVARKAGELMGLSSWFEAGGGAMDGNIYNAKGMEVIGVATGYTKNHTKEEQLVLKDFFLSGELCAKLIEAYADTCPQKGI